MNDRLTEQKHESFHSTSVAIFTVVGGVACVVWPVVVAGGCYCCWVARPGGAGPLVRGRQPEPGRSQSHLQQLSLLTLPTPPQHSAPPATQTLASSRKKTSKSEQTFQMSTSLAIVNQTFVNIYLSGLVPTHSQQCTAPTGHQPHTLNLDTGGSLKLKRKFGNLSK